MCGRQLRLFPLCFEVEPLKLVAIYEGWSSWMAAKEKGNGKGSSNDNNVEDDDNIS